MASDSHAEIELKFLIKNEQIEKIREHLERSGEAIEALQLANQYFDTQERILHKHKIGLRIRRWNDQLEQTIKLAGRQSGALSSRPEYNVKLAPAGANYAAPDLALFPRDIWPSSISPTAIQGALSEQFAVHFARQRWLLVIAETTIEVAIDRGAITAGELSEPVLELEAELVSGDVSTLISWADELQQQFLLIAGSQSKAQRGFALAAKAAAMEHK